ncbi:hypothetical protein F0267_00985 [Vibrio coralliilyticus]|uniref:Uncharacterized protein n=1 Tax=Vibrio coralliilyticus TaxID=190893 RepID=A0AAN0SKE6_9VIBR|nr:hypothetical protein [Vibrio coralliilyticus]AIW22695.1 hypothetical protein IX92_26945 [Vibrio coralliilyticus]NOH36796.1 hypothetical protein [Vibrio coralliilyticus]
MAHANTGKSCVVQDLLSYVLSDHVSVESTEFLPLSAASILLNSTSTTLKQRIEQGELREKSFITSSPVTRTFIGVEAGGVKRLLLERTKYIELIREHVTNVINAKSLTSYGAVLDLIELDWKSPPARKLSNDILDLLNDESIGNISSSSSCMVTAVVISKSKNMPTEHFFRKAIETGLLAKDADQIQRITFWKTQLELVYEKYGDDTA